jgi:hypothetical protein
MQNGNCPTCGMPLEPGEDLVAYYYAPKNWWVVAHLGPGEQTAIMGEMHMEIPKRKIICHQSRYETPMLIGQRQAQTGPG